MSQEPFAQMTDAEIARIYREAHEDPYKQENEMMRMNPDE
jgi:hypothetical protein